MPFRKMIFVCSSIVGGQLATIIDNLHLYEEIKESEEKYRTVVEGAMDGVVVVGENYHLKYVNERMAEIVGYSQEELTERIFGDFWTKKARS